MCVQVGQGDPRVSSLMEGVGCRVEGVGFRVSGGTPQTAKRYSGRGLQCASGDRSRGLGGATRWGSEGWSRYYQVDMLGPRCISVNFEAEQSPGSPSWCAQRD
jgi:hypothetical protein